jgi:hypothetical protein
MKAEFDDLNWLRPARCKPKRSREALWKLTTVPRLSRIRNTPMRGNLISSKGE